MAKMMYCPNCGQAGTPKKIIPGSFLITVFLLLWMILPGLIYMVWRHKATYWACPSCLARNMIPLDAPNAPQGRAIARAIGNAPPSG